ncbi:hypothetical protein GCM10023340_19030 [Nocardioides marinquilinus]|uniref:Putative restriction endonuclease domain-containing protein n=1 Tax=Nocardioides marinquilinus TaxID=1210400 RepID=A0ABP9PIB8_9ACTN
MSAQPDEPVSRVRMSWQDYLDLHEQPEKSRAEWVAGEVVVVNAPPLFGHGVATVRLIVCLTSHLPDLHVVTEVFLRLPRDRVRLSDVMVTRTRPPDGWVTEPPVLVAEVLSRATRSEDTLRKSTEYAEGGVGQYWILDPELRTLDALGNDGGGWQVLAHLDDDRPTGEVEVDGVRVPLDLEQLLPP